MTCTESYKAMARIFSSTSLVDEISKLSDQAAKLEQRILNETDDAIKASLTQTKANIEWAREAAILWWLLAESWNNIKIKSWLLKKLRSSNAYTQSVVDIFDAIDDVASQVEIEKALDILGSNASLSSIRSKAVNSLKNEEAIASFFNHREPWNTNFQLITQINEIVGENSNNLNYYLTVSNLFRPWETIDLQKTLDGLKWDFVDVVKPETLVKEINNVKTLKELLDITTFNLATYKASTPAVRAFKNKLDELKNWVIEWERDILSELKWMQKDIASWWRLWSDDWFFARIKDLWYNQYIVDPDKTKREIWKIIRSPNSKETITIDWKELWYENVRELVRILWPWEILRQWLWTNSERLAGIIVETFKKQSDTDLAQVMGYINDSDAEWLETWFTLNGERIWIAPIHAGEHLIRDVTTSNIDFDNAGIFFDWARARFWKNSEELWTRVQAEENQYTRNSIDTKHEVEYAWTVESLKSFIERNPDQVNVFVQDDFYGTWWDLQQVVQDANKLRDPKDHIRLVTSNKQFSNFKFGYDWPSWNLTVRSKNEVGRRELLNKRIYVDGDIRAIDPIIEDVPTVEYSTSKEAWLGWMVTWFINRAAAWDEVVQMSDEDIIEEIKKYFTSIWQEVTNSATVIDNNLKKDFFNWKYAHVDWDLTNSWIRDGIQNWVNATKKLESYVGIENGEKAISHAAVSTLFFRLKELWLDIPLTWVKRTLKNYIESWTIDDSFITAINSTNNQTIREWWLWASEQLVTSLLEQTTRLLKRDVDVVDVPTSGEWFYVWAADQRGLIDVDWSSIGLNSPEDAAKLANDYVNWAEEIVGRIKEEVVKQNIPAWQTGTRAQRSKIDRLYEELFNFMDIKDMEMESMMGFLYNNKDKGRIFSGKKFLTKKVFSAADVDNIDDIFRQTKETILWVPEDFKSRIKKSVWDNPDGSRVIKEWNVYKRITLADQIINEASTWAYARRNKPITRNYIESLDTQSQRTLLQSIQDTNKADIWSKWFVRYVLESTSDFLRQQKFFDNYVLQDVWGIKLPRAVIETETQWIDQLSALAVKRAIYDDIVTMLKDPARSTSPLTIKQQKQRVFKSISDHIDSVKIADNAEKTPEQIKNEFAVELWYDFEPYAHITWVKKEAIEKIRERYNIQDGVNGDEWDDYIDDWLERWLWEGAFIEDYTKFDDPTISALWDAANDAARKQIELDTEWLKDLWESYAEYSQWLFQFTFRNLSDKSPWTRRILSTANSVHTNQSVWLRRELDALLIWPANWLWQAIISQRWTFDFLTLAKLNKKAFFNSVITDANQAIFKEAQEIVPSIIDLNDTAYKETVRQLMSSDAWRLAVRTSDYFREIRKGLWTDNTGSWPSSDPQFNIAAHNMYRQFTESWSTKQDIYNTVYEMKSAADSASILRHMNSQRVKDNAWPLFDRVSLAIDASDDSSTAVWDTLALSANQQLIVDGWNAFRQLFWDNFTDGEYLTTLDTMFGVREQADIYKNINRAISALWIIPWAPTIAKASQFWRTLLTGAQSILWYIPVVAGIKNWRSPLESIRAWKIRRAVGFWTELQEPRSILELVGEWSIPKRIEELSQNSQSREDAWANSQEIKELFNKWLERSVLWNAAAFMKFAKNRLLTTPVSDTFQFLSQNGNNAYDFFFLWFIKDNAYLEWILNNRYRKFNNLDEFEDFVDSAPRQEVEALMKEVDSTAAKVIFDVSWNTFSAVNRWSNPFSGRSRFLYDWWLTYQRSVSYLNGWWRNKQAAARRFIWQTIQLAKWIWRWDIDWVTEFLVNTPEYRIFAKQLADQVVFATRIHRAKDDDDEEDLFTPRKLYDALLETSQTLQWLQIVAENRPIFGAIDAATDWEVVTEPWERFKKDFSSIQFSFLTIPWKVLEMHADILNEATVLMSDGQPTKEALMASISAVINQNIIQASKWTFRFAIESDDFGARFSGVSWQDALPAFAWIWYDDPLDQIVSDTKYKADFSRWMWNNGSLETPFYKLTKFFRPWGKIANNILTIIDKDKDVRDLTSISNQTALATDLARALNGSNTIQTFKQQWRVNIQYSEIDTVADEFFKVFEQPMPFLMSTSTLVDRLSKSDTWELFDDEFNKVTEVLFDTWSTEEKNQLIDSLWETENILKNWKDASWKDKQKVLSQIQDEWDRQYITLRTVNNKNLSWTSDIMRRYQNSILSEQMELFEWTEEYEMLKRMEYASSLIDQDFGAWIQWKQNKIDRYNEVWHIFMELFEREWRDFLGRTVARREWKVIQEELWVTLFNKDFTDVNGKLQDGLKQYIEIFDAADKWDSLALEVALSDLSKAVYKDFDSDEANLRALDWSLQLVDALNRSTKLSEQQKAYYTIAATKSFFEKFNIWDFDFDKYWEDGKRFEQSAYRALYKTEEQIRESGILDDIWDLNNESLFDKEVAEEAEALANKKLNISAKRSWNVAAARSRSGWTVAKAKKAPTSKVTKAKVAKAKANKIKVSLKDTKAFASNLSKSLDSKRSQYKLDSIEYSETQPTDGIYEQAIKQTFPPSLSAKTKVPSWLTKRQLNTRRRDISRNISAPKRKKLKIPLI